MTAISLAGSYFNAHCTEMPSLLLIRRFWCVSM